MWKQITSAVPKNTILFTCIWNEQGLRNEQNLIFDGKLWWTEDKSMYVYYTPTHYKL